MNKIKVWDNKNKCWVENFFINKLGQAYNFSVDTAHPYQRGSCIIGLKDLIDATVCHYIGMNDKKGEMLFKGDIIKADQHTPEYYYIDFVDGAYCATRYGMEGYCLDMNHFYPSVGCQIEKAGNIFENKNLLERK